MAAEHELVQQIRQWARQLGFSQIGVAGIDLSDAEPGLLAWLEQGFHGEMHYMERHGLKRARPAELVPGTLSIVTARMDYLAPGTPPGWQALELARLQQPGQAVVSLYARGRDYHKVLRQRLQKLAERIAQAVGPLGHRVFTDSAPVLEAELARRSGLGWRGKHTLLLSRQAGSMFFLGEIFLDLALPPTPATSAHCGACRACMDICPTQAIVAPGQVDARRCISYLTIEHPGPIPEPLRPAMGNRLYGCDDCQLACPWNKFAQPSVLADFAARPALQQGDLLSLLGWSEAEFLQHTEGSPIRRIGYARWQRNLAVVSGNALRAAQLPQAQARLLCQHLQRMVQDPAGDALVREHAAWALAQAGMALVQQG
ncbi:tRNA epoxyqueuosine(34) reductase QueG [Vandammella animalimorsus]|uniref:tRNA epoxyqueuosine(34) reductase QueG n=1 Tax=Vandammella animalimorsus TaxID=2029117 RepID=UPI001EED8D80|nr:tRNA epoxyqueuosine(34) reductase QueG [Vandammella animalimorsus]